jgi:hypothetical protein
MAGTAAALGALAVGSAASGGAAATAGLIGFGGSVSALGALSLAGTGIGILSSIGASNTQKGEARQAAYDEDLQAKAARLRGLQESNRIRKALIRDVSSATARAGQTGQGGGLLSQQVAGIESEGADAQNVTEFNTNMEVRRRKAQSAIYRKTGRSSILDVIGPVAQGTASLATQAAYR